MRFRKIKSSQSWNFFRYFFSKWSIFYENRTGFLIWHFQKFMNPPSMYIFYNHVEDYVITVLPAHHSHSSFCYVIYVFFILLYYIIHKLLICINIRKYTSHEQQTTQLHSFEEHLNHIIWTFVIILHITVKNLGIFSIVEYRKITDLTAQILALIKTPCQHRNCANDNADLKGTEMICIYLYRKYTLDKCV